MTGLSWTLAAYGRVADLVGAETGLAFSDARCLDAEAGIRRAMTKAGVADPAAYLEKLESKAIPLEDLVDELTVGETYFFRDPAQFVFLREEILPAIRGSLESGRPALAWSAGCSTGEEAYSLAILFEEEGLALGSRILATDLSRAALEKARRGVYGPWALRASDAEFKARYFHATGTRYRIDERFRRNLDFRVHNLAQESPPAPAAAPGMDLILCRNVLIYLETKTIEKVARRLVEALAPGGWLLTGPSDPPLGDLTPCAAVVTSAGIYYQRLPETARAAPERRFALEASPRPPSWGTDPVGESPPKGGGPEGREKEKSRSAVDVLPPAASVLEEARKARSRGDYARVLELTATSGGLAEAEALCLEALANLRGSEEAERAALERISKEPASVPLRFLRSMLLLDLGREKEAAEELRKVLYLDPSLAAAQFTLGMILKRRGDPTGARRAFRNVLRAVSGVPPEEKLPLASGETAGRLGDLARGELGLLEGGR